MRYIILIDFGSTFTKSTIIDVKLKKNICSIQYPSSVNTDARISLNKCFKDMKNLIGLSNFYNAKKYASSSAAGGLRISVVGLTKSLSLSAAKNAAFGAGGKIVKIYNGKLKENDLLEIVNSSTEILLFCGGYEGGNKSILLHNAKVISESELSCPIIYCGNSDINKEVYTILKSADKDCYITPNIIPNINELYLKETEYIIRRLFMKRIINMKGIKEIAKNLDAPIIPTPAVVLSAGELLSKGTDNYKGWGETMIIDIGGATTDIHSYSNNIPYKGSHLSGAKEPYSKRTVEGDLGMRESSMSLIRELGIDKVSIDLNTTKDILAASIDSRVINTNFLPTTDFEIKIDQYLASMAIKLATRRHVGFIDNIYSSQHKYIQFGKNLDNIKNIIGTGGAIIHSKDPKNLLSNSTLNSDDDNKLLLPQASSYYIDKDYILYTAGLLSFIDKDLAFNIMENSLTKL